MMSNTVDLWISVSCAIWRTVRWLPGWPSWLPGRQCHCHSQSKSPWTTSFRKQPTLRAAENTTQIWRALLRLCWSGSLEQPSVISSRTNRYYSF